LLCVLFALQLPVRANSQGQRSAGVWAIPSCRWAPWARCAVHL